MGGAFQRKAGAVSPRSGRRWTWALGLAAATSSSLLGCPNTGGGTAYTPITGLVFRATSVTAGYGCGEGDGQVYRYAVYVWPDQDAGPDASDEGADSGSPAAGGAMSCPADAGQACANAGSVASLSDAGSVTGPPWVGVYDCFADAIFANLPTNDAGFYTYSAALFAFDKKTYDYLTSDAAAPLPACDPAHLDNSVCLPFVTAVAPSANWANTCTATQVLGVPAIADCCPLAVCNAPPESGLDAAAGDDGADDGAGETGFAGDAEADTTLEAALGQDGGSDATVDATANGQSGDADTEASFSPGEGGDTGPDATVDAATDAEGGADATLGDAADGSNE